MTLIALSVLFLLVGNSSAQASNLMGSYTEPVFTGWDTFEASSMIGSQLLTTEGDYLGIISDLVIDPGSGHISEVVLSDVPESGGEKVSVPFAALSHTGNNIFVFNRPEEYSGWFNGEAFFSHWAEVRYLYSVEPVPTGAFDTATLIGAPIQTSQGENIGQVNDLVIDFSKGRVAYSVLSDGGGMEGKMVAVPFSELDRSAGNVFALNITKERLLSAPTFAWTDIGDRRYAESVYRYYGVQPYWEETR